MARRRRRRRRREAGVGRAAAGRRVQQRQGLGPQAGATQHNQCGHSTSRDVTCFVSLPPQYDSCCAITDVGLDLKES